MAKDITQRRGKKNFRIEDIGLLYSWTKLDNMHTWQLLIKAIKIVGTTIGLFFAVLLINLECRAEL